jgi:hypothetical protein
VVGRSRRTAGAARSRDAIPLIIAVAILAPTPFPVVLAFPVFVAFPSLLPFSSFKSIPSFLPLPA